MNIAFLQTNITFLVQDTKNGSATLSPRIQLCRCENGGECYVPEASSEQTAAVQNAFLIMSCNCPLGRTGKFCGEVRDFCTEGLTPPCNALVTCTNTPTSFMCGNCPNGYEGNGQTCSGQYTMTIIDCGYSGVFSIFYNFQCRDMLFYLLLSLFEDDIYFRTRTALIPNFEPTSFAG